MLAPSLLVNTNSRFVISRVRTDTYMWRLHRFCTFVLPALASHEQNSSVCYVVAIAHNLHRLSVSYFYNACTALICVKEHSMRS